MFQDFLLFFLSFFLLTFSFPPFYFFPLAFFSFIPFFILIDKKKRPFLLGFLFFSLFSLIQLHWIFNLTKIEKSAAFWIILGCFLLFFYHGLYFGVFSIFFKKFKNKKFSFVLIPLLWVLLEIVRAKGETGFPWIVLFLTQKNNLPLIQISEITGPFFISFIVMFLNYSFYSRRKDLIFSSLLILIFLELTGFYLLKREIKPLKKIKVAIYQPDIPLIYSVKEELETGKKIYDSLRVEGVLLSIFPESSLPSFIRYDTSVQKVVYDFVRKTNSYLIFGNADAIKDKKGYKIFNAAFLVDRYGYIRDFYYKTHLTPFGEAIPYDEKFPILRKLDFGEGNYSRGRTLRLFKIDNFKAFVMICFESIFTEISREAVKKGANVLINITSDGWFGPSLGPKVHRDLAIFRAIETRRYILRSARSGISCVIDEKGRVIDEISLFKRGVLKEEIDLYNYVTFYVKFGKFIEVSFFGIFLLLLTFSLLHKRFFLFQTKRDI